MLDPARELVQLVRSRSLRSRTGILLLAREHLGAEPDLAARLNVEALDYSAYVDESLPEDTRFVSVTPASEIARLDAIASASADYDCVLIYNLDLILSKLDHSARLRIWSSLRENFPYRTRSLILALPQHALIVQPDGDERYRWEASGRLVSYQPLS